MTCEGKCERYKADMKGFKKRYREGVKRCGSCGIFIKYSGITCPCCEERLRSKPKNPKK